jgi:hypothetical protein
MHKKCWSENLKGRGKRLVGRPRHRCEDNVRMDLEIG